MDTKEGKSDTRGCTSTPAANTNGSTDTDFVLQWGNKKRNRFNKLKANNSNFIQASHSLPITNGKATPTVSHRVIPANKCSSSPQNQENHVSRPESPGINGKTLASPEKEDRYYTTRGSLLDDNGKVMVDNVKKDKKLVWPKLFVTLSSKEKEEDFMAMKGCKPPHRPKKRAKLIQRSVLLVSPGGWLSELCQERYEVREKKTSKKRPRGLKAMGSMESDSE